MLDKPARPLLMVAVAVFSCIGIASTAFANSAALKTGTRTVGEYIEAVKTADGKEKRKFVVHYDWDTGATYTYTHNMNGKLLDKQVTYGEPTPDEAEVAEAIAIVNDHPEVKSIKNRQAGISIEGGFPYRPSSGVCAAPARCLQIFLFDAENVVRHMMVDMRSSRVVMSDYIPPQNQEERE